MIESERGRRLGRPPKISEAEIADAVLAEGFAGLTVPAVAERLGVSSMTLYRHVPNRAGLLAAGWARVVDTATWPPLDLPWRELLAAHAHRLWDLLAEHPGVVTEMSAAIFPPRMARLFDDLAVALVGQGFDPTQAMLAVDIVIDLTLDHRRGVETLAQQVEGSTESLREQIGAVWGEELSDGDDRGPAAAARRAVRQAMSEAITEDPRVWFDRKLAVVLEGIAATCQCSDPRPSASHPTNQTAGKTRP